MTTPAERIAKAKAATAAIDRQLWPAIDHLQRIGQVSNGAGIYADVSALRSALTRATLAVALALQAIRETEWPTEEDYGS